MVRLQKDRVSKSIDDNHMTWGQFFIFNDCGRGFRMISVVNQCICTLAAAILTLKYQLVASSMSRYVTGNIEDMALISKIKAVFFLLFTFIFVTLIAYLVLATKRTSGE